MKESINSLRNIGRLAGLFNLLCAGSTIFGVLYVRSKLIIFIDANATVNNIMENEFLFRASIAVNILSQLFLLAWGMTVFRLFREISKNLTTIFLIAVALTVVIALVNTSNNVAVLAVLSKTNYLKIFQQEEINAFVMIFLGIGKFVQGLLEIFWGLYLFIFGLLIIKSKFAPKILGILLIIGSFAFPINSFTKLLIPNFYPEIITQMTIFLGSLGGIPTIFWFLIKGASLKSGGKLQGYQ